MELDSDIEVLVSASVAQDTPTAKCTAAGQSSARRVLGASVLCWSGSARQAVWSSAPRSLDCVLLHGGPAAFAHSFADVKSGSKVAKGAADGASKGSKVKKDKAPAKPVKAKKGKVELPVVALKNGKFVLRQKVLSSDKLQSVARGICACC